MMIELFRDQRRASHEAERLVEVLEHELSGDGIAAFHLAPAIKLGKRALARTTGEFRCHGRHLVIAAIVPRMAPRQPLAKAPRALTYLPESRRADLPPRSIGRRSMTPRWISPGGSDVLVAQYRQDRRNGGSHPRHFPVVSRLDLRCQLGSGRTGDGLAKPRLPGAPVRLRGGARIRPH